MNDKRFPVSLRKLGLVMIVAVVVAAPSFAVTYDLRACATTVTIAGSPTPIWGYDQLTNPAPCTATIPGPMLIVPPGDTSLTINLTNNLPVATSVVIPGQIAQLTPQTFTDGQGRQRVWSFTSVANPAGSASYTWTGLKPGTYLYHSGTNPALQVQMGLYGGAKIDAAAGEAYPGVGYDTEVVLIYSEIDPALHAGTTAANPTNYKPKYFLVNGRPYVVGQLPVPAGNVDQTVLIRLLNAGLKSHVPALHNAYMNVVAEDGNRYPYAKEQYSVLLPPGKTLDAIWDPTAVGTYAVYDRSLHLTNNGVPGGGMLTYLEVVANGGAPVAANDSYSVAEDAVLNVPAPGVLGNDSPSNGTTAVLATGASHGTVSLGSDGSFTYTPAPNFNGTDTFTYKVKSGNKTSNNAGTVTITVTPTPDTAVAANDAVTTTKGSPITFAVLANDVDADGDALTVTNLTQPTPGSGSVVVNLDQTVTYTPPDANFTGLATFTYTAFDGVSTSNVATVTVTVSAAVNQPPVAADDTASTTRNTNVAIPINVIANDSDPDGSIVPSTVQIVDQPTQGGTAVALANGTVAYTPKKGFQGTDVFTYTVQDNGGATSNLATVRVNVVK